jgi:hypothetical protein
VIRAANHEWLGTKRWLKQQIKDAQVELEQPERTEAQHNLTRGKIAAFRQIIREVEPGDQPEPDEEAPYFP